MLENKFIKVLEIIWAYIVASALDIYMPSAHLLEALAFVVVIDALIGLRMSFVVKGRGICSKKVKEKLMEVMIFMGLLAMIVKGDSAFIELNLTSTKGQMQNWFLSGYVIYHILNSMKNAARISKPLAFLSRFINTKLDAKDLPKLESSNEDK